MMRTSDWLHQASGAQAILDKAPQVIVALDLIQAAGNVGQFFAMADSVAEELTRAGIKHRPNVLLAEAATARTTTRTGPTPRASPCSPPLEASSTTTHRLRDRADRSQTARPAQSASRVSSAPRPVWLPRPTERDHRACLRADEGSPPTLATSPARTH